MTTEATSRTPQTAKPSVDPAVRHLQPPTCFQQAALAYARQGWHVFPLHPSCGEEDPKAPLGYLVPNGFKNATTDLDTLRKWWGQYPQANVGVATGMVSGVVVLDVDPRDGGDASLANLEAEHGPLPTTLVTRTGSGGSHYWFACPDGGLHSRKPYQGIDFKADGGYVVAPPSIHPNGQAYRFESSDWTVQLPLPALPGWLLECIRNKQKRSTYHGPSTDGVYAVSTNYLENDPLERHKNHIRPDTLKLIETDALWGRYNSRSERDFRVILQLHHAGLLPGEIKDVFRTYPIGQTLHQRKSDVEAYLDRTIFNADPLRVIADRHLSLAYEILCEIRQASQYRRRITVPLTSAQLKRTLRERSAIDEQTFRKLLKVLTRLHIRKARQGKISRYYLNRFAEVLDALEDGNDSDRGSLLQEQLLTTHWRPANGAPVLSQVEDAEDSPSTSPSQNGNNQERSDRPTNDTPPATPSFLPAQPEATDVTVTDQPQEEN
mgnify:CR=1 FL=1